MARLYVKHRWLKPPYSARIAGVYAIINSLNSKIYIGSAINLNHRWAEHRSELERGQHGNRHLQRAFNKEPDAFQLEVISELPGASKKELLDCEQLWMDFFQSYLPSRGYNIAPKAESCQGITRDPEQCAEMSRRQKGVKWSEERKAAWRAQRVTPRGWHWSEAQKLRHSQRMLGKPHSYGWKIALAHKRNPPSARPVLQFSCDGRFIARFNTAKDAEIQLGRRLNIAQACHGIRRQSGGYVWKYASEGSELEHNPIRARRPKGPQKTRICQAP